jgi:hypothetical protein
MSTPVAVVGEPTRDDEAWRDPEPAGEPAGDGPG